MKCPVPTRRAFTIALVFAAGPFAVSCGDGEGITAPRFGTLRITTTTMGTEIDVDGYTVQIDGGDAQALGVAAELTRCKLYRVRGQPSDCGCHRRRHCNDSICHNLRPDDR